MISMHLMDLSCARQLLLILSLASSIALATETDRVRYVDSADPKQSYFIDLLTLTLEASKNSYGDYKLQPVSIKMAQARTSIMLQRDEYIDITWRMTTKELEQRLQAIYFPILKGLMGNRIFIINKNQQHLFTKNTSLDDLKNIDLGQGHNWPDTDILIENGFSVIKGKDDLLMTMLKKNRFDYYPRALHEPWVEISDKEALSVEKNLMLQYPAPIFFFVNKHNKRLQQRLSYGLNHLLESGKFEQFFLNHRITSGILAKANVDKRTIFSLHNSLLSDKTKALLDNKSLWIKLQ